MTKKKPRKTGRPHKHGGYCLSFARDELLRREHPRVRQYLEDVRAGLVRDVAGGEDRLTEQQRVMIDRIISRLAICRLIEIHVSKNGAFMKYKGKPVSELVPALGQSYLAYVNSIDRALVALGLDKKKADEVLDLGRYIEQRDAEKPPAKDKGGAEIGQPERTSGDESGQGEGERQ